MNENQRIYPRTTLQIDVKLNFLEDSPRDLVTKNISLGGLFIQLDDPTRYPLGELVNVLYSDPLNNNTDTEKDAVIVRVAENGIAVAFIEMDSF